MGLRIRRVNEILREVIAEECRNLKDPRIGFLTVTGVSTSPDLRNAEVYYTVLGDDEAEASTAEALQSAAPRVRAAVGHQVRMKYLPRLRFVPDPAVAHARRIEEILRGMDQTEETEAGYDRNE
ncbi:MAG: 30S ribosome-binding factor RbfA [Acidimicrobiia bacterium]|nr:30S ribosome-binding factor RbfA [bacterium]MXX64104.1 30S ribosome-binding factor RbfA [Acidimicrobiia bacterium]MCY3580913.1 30S ribosome-binding factor RbfA [bacterium]MCY3652117.1 30S ribosome-binding factor RbfA [bacterium]MDE0642928.1 30S ribosome-binding factor RbfA [bacterium]